MVEVSIPEVFATNYGKLGEIIIAGDANLVVDPGASEDDLLNAYLSQVVFVRLLSHLLPCQFETTPS